MKKPVLLGDGLRVQPPYAASFSFAVVAAGVSAAACASFGRHAL
jgi:hypothetical protein